MGISERREREKIERRKTIMNCARELILLNGIQNVSMDDIARKAELSKATVYLYFSSKDVLFNEICEETARVFLNHLQPFLDSGVRGMTALKYFWRGYIDLFGRSEEMLIIFHVRNFIDPGLPLVSFYEKSKSPNIDAILQTLHLIINQCKNDGIFDPTLDTAMATRLLLSMFSFIVDNLARMIVNNRKYPAAVDEMTSAFQILVRGFAKEGIDRSILDIGVV